MKTTQLYRAQLGLSQEAMSQYLGVTKSQLAMYEAGKRELPTAALIKLAEITQFFGLNIVTEEEQIDLLNKQELDVKVLLTHQVKELEYKQMKEQRLLDAIQKKYHQNLELHSLALHLQKSKLPLANVLLQQAIRGIEANGLAKQVQQQLKLESIQGQQAYIKSLQKSK
ncbi:helix-turn-helix domain-containing protein [Flavobacterium limnophilum]|jgi:transcriptional regulator with XRE-family HTH domain|uniref:helix-turn-helix domain-containing protein n=1 Tax=Flavobacterium limnophilum TaxID=3003262 RepID=UPI00248244AF|nr:helix-turn-helix transcriptional regulator [Flavobacterium limnophilum]